jgi:hypothetical protein
MESSPRWSEDVVFSLIVRTVPRSRDIRSAVVHFRLRSMVFLVPRSYLFRVNNNSDRSSGSQD